MKLTDQKDKEGRRIMLKLSKPRKPTKHNKDRYHAKPEDFEKLYSYCIQDVKTESAVSRALGPLSSTERKIWLMDQGINFRGVYIDRVAVRGALAILKQLATETNEKIQQLTAGQVTAVTQTAKLKAFLNEQDLDLSGVGRPVLEKALEEPDIDPLAREIMELRLASSKSSTAKYEAMWRRMDDDDRIREIILYHGAHSGRWTGLGIQIQNFPKGTIKNQDDVDQAIEIIKTGSAELLKICYGSNNAMGILSSCLRGMICAAPGNRLLCADYASIEARFLMWLVGEHEAVEMFRRGEDIYKSLASVIFSKPVEDINDFPERDLGKRGILGAGYQMGPKKFRETCEKYGSIISEALAKKAIKAYRKKYSKIPEFWKAIEAAAIKAVLKKGKSIICGKVICKCGNDFLTIKLPSGRKLHYYDPAIRFDEKYQSAKLTYMGVDPLSKKWVRINSYGGKLTENIVQAACRDFMALAMLELTRRGYPIVLTVHDEIASERKIGEGTLDEFCDIMSTVPDWAPGMPLAVDGWEGKRFRK